MVLNLGRREIIRRGIHKIILRIRATGGQDPTVLTIATDQKKERWGEDIVP